MWNYSEQYFYGTQYFSFKETKHVGEILLYHYSRFNVTWYNFSHFLITMDRNYLINSKFLCIQANILSFRENKSKLQVDPR